MFFKKKLEQSQKKVQDEQNDQMAIKQQQVKDQIDEFKINIQNIESKLIQERLKNEQKKKDFSKLEDNYNYAKTELDKYVQLYNQNEEKVCFLEKKNQDKKNLLISFKQKIQDLQNKQKEWELSIISHETIQEQQEVIPQQIDLQSSCNQLNISQDIKMKSQENQLLEFQEKLNNLQQEFSLQQDELLNKEKQIKQLENQNQILKQKRESAIKEIQRLNDNLNETKIENMIENPQSSLKYLRENSSFQTKFIDKIKKDLKQMHNGFHEIIYNQDERNANHNIYVNFDRQLINVLTSFEDFSEMLEKSNV